MFVDNSAASCDTKHDDNFNAKRRHSLILILISQHLKTFTKLRITKQWSWEVPNPADSNDKQVYEWGRELPGT